MKLNHDVALFLALLAALPVSTTTSWGQTLLFSSGFESDTQFGEPDNCWNSGCLQSIAGTDASTGHTWETDSGIWGGNPAGFLLLADGPTDAQTIHEFMFNQILSVTGHQGAATNVLYSQVTQSGCCGGDTQNGATQNSFQILPDPNVPQGDLRIRYWLKLQPDLEKQLNPGGWRYVFSWKTGANVGSDDGDYRVELLVVTWDQPTPYWQLRGDNAARPLGLENTSNIGK